MSTATGPLSGLLVADFSRVLAGPYATMLLADLGAEVVKVEGPGGDDTRAWTPPVRGGASLPGYDLIVQAISGLMSLTGSPDGPPYRAGISVFDVIAGLHTAIGVLAALHERAASGHGQHVEVSLLASALSGMVNHTSAFVAGGVVPYRMGNAHPSLFPYEPLPTGDGELIAAGVPCGPINTVDDGVAFAEEVGLSPVVSPGGMPSVRNPISLSRTPPSYRLPPPPGLNEHGAEIRAWLTTEEGR